MNINEKYIYIGILLLSLRMQPSPMTEYVIRAPIIGVGGRFLGKVYTGESLS